MPTIIHFYTAFLSKQVHLDSKVSLKNPYRTRFSCTVQDFAILSGEYPPPKNDVRGRVALEEGPMIIYGSGGGPGRGIYTVPLFVKVFLPVPPSPPIPFSLELCTVQQ